MRSEHRDIIPSRYGYMGIFKVILYDEAMSGHTVLHLLVLQHE